MDTIEAQPQTRRAHCDAQDSAMSAWHMWPKRNGDSGECVAANHAGIFALKLRKPAMSARKGVNPLTKEECVFKQSRMAS